MEIVHKFVKDKLESRFLQNRKWEQLLPVDYATHTRKTDENMKFMSQCIKHDEHQWLICGDLNVVAILMGRQGGHTKHCCFLCEWDSWWEICTMCGETIHLIYHWKKENVATSTIADNCGSVKNISYIIWWKVSPCYLSDEKAVSGKMEIRNAFKTMPDIVNK